MAHWIPTLDQNIIEGEQATIRVRIVDFKGDPLEGLTGSTLEAVVIDPDGITLNPTVTAEDQTDADLLGIVYFVLTTLQTKAGRYYVRFLVDSEPVHPRGAVGYIVMGYDPADIH